MIRTSAWSSTARRTWITSTSSACSTCCNKPTSPKSVSPPKQRLEEVGRPGGGRCGHETAGAPFDNSEPRRPDLASRTLVFCSGRSGSQCGCKAAAGLGPVLLIRNHRVISSTCSRISLEREHENEPFRSFRLAGRGMPRRGIMRATSRIPRQARWIETTSTIEIMKSERNPSFFLNLLLHRQRHRPENRRLWVRSACLNPENRGRARHRIVTIPPPNSHAGPIALGRAWEMS